MKADRPHWAGVMLSWAAPAVIAATLGVLGPFDTFSLLAPAARLIFWFGVVFAMAVVVRTLWWGLQRPGLPLGPLRRFSSVIAAAMGAAPVTWFGFWFLAVLAPTPVAPLPDPARFAFFYGCALCLCLLAFMLKPREGGSSDPPSHAGGGIEPGADPARADRDFLLRRTPRFAAARLLYLEAEDHYLRVHTDQGSELILMRMRDAVEELSGAPGRQVHRSFWISDAAAAAVVRKARTVAVRMIDGRTIPVSRPPVLAELKLQKAASQGK